MLLRTRNRRIALGLRVFCVLSVALTYTIISVMKTAGRVEQADVDGRCMYLYGGARYLYNLDLKF